MRNAVESLHGLSPRRDQLVEAVIGMVCDLCSCPLWARIVAEATARPVLRDTGEVANDVAGSPAWARLDPGRELIRSALDEADRAVDGGQVRGPVRCSSLMAAGPERGG
jgi:hypothetical protein